MEFSRTDPCALLDMLFDAGTYTLVGAYEKGNSGDGGSGIVTAFGSVCGRPVYTFVQNRLSSRCEMTAEHAAKIKRIYELAMKSRAPIVGVLASDGAHIAQETDMLNGYGEVMRVVRRAKKLIPQIAFVDGACGGISTAIASMFDFTVLNRKDGSWHTAAPFLLKQMEPGVDFGSIAFANSLGAASLCAENSEQGMELVRKLLSYLPDCLSDGCVVCPTGDDINSERSVPSGVGCRALAEAICDQGSFLEIGGGYASEMMTALAVLNDRVIGLVATDKEQNGGRITVNGARKAAEWISLCNRMRLPIVTLVDSEGVAILPEQEKANLGKACACLAEAYIDATVPLISVVVGKAYGAAYVLLGSRGIGADLVFAVENSEIGTMSPEALAEFMYRQALREGGNRAELVEKCRKETLSPYHAGEKGYVDFVLPRNELSCRIAAAIEMLALKDGTV